jgi:magnesium-transporting ATPase (P-type)
LDVEAAIMLELLLANYVEAAIIAALLVFNAGLGLFQESRAQATLAALRSRIALNASVRREGAWKTKPAVELVPGDVAGDFLAMSLTTDNVRPSQSNSWRICSLTMAGVVMGICLPAFYTAVLAIGNFEIGLGIDELRTPAFTALVFGSQVTIYAIRQRGHLWGTRPSLWLAVSSVADILIASILAVRGIAMTPPAGLGGRQYACRSGCFLPSFWTR